ncbi:hypothetical protein H7U19_01430 [Hyunsoonleella sp. SJ7]|uniref:TonB C-terminal domain-containing protein n=1 Tax=Hyunsoonleella aquatilis TaxID=2762758 RepID=A0A923H8W9_9FLAO|nr:hypothetical protein [Hyunsoonleella aquatilis]MBC3757047.1 hypothetical protein [Hyunsoonleella aquatilis]
MRPTLILILLFTLMSCEYFNIKKTTPEAILKEELKTFNWDEVDTYPSFSQCDSLSLKEEKKSCFESTLYAEISGFLQNQIIVVTEDVNDTLQLEFKVSKQGDLFLMKTEMDSLTQQQIPQLQRLLQKSLDSLPRIYPAIKRGQQVATEFKLPVIITVD